MKQQELEQFMRLALEEAKAAFEEDEVPVGAVVVKDGTVISKAHNRCMALHDMTAHAEFLAMREAAGLLGGRLTGCVLYVTLEPCAMCAGAALNYRLTDLVYGAYDPESGCCGSVADITDHWFPLSLRSIGGILEKECSALLTSFFKTKH